MSKAKKSDIPFLLIYLLCGFSLQKQEAWYGRSLQPQGFNGFASIEMSSGRILPQGKYLPDTIVNRTVYLFSILIQKTEILEHEIISGMG